MPQPRSALKLASLAVLAFAALAPVPALARNSAHDAGLAEVESRLSDPDTQQAMGDALAGMMAALLDMKAAPFAKAMDKMGKSMGGRPMARNIPDDATLGDLAGPDARRAPGKIAAQVPQMMGAMGAMTGVMQEMLPQLEEMGKRMGEQMGKSIERAEQRTGRGRD
jgi:hypothetical protein